MSRWYLVLIGTLFAHNLSAQGTVVRPEPKLDAGRAALRDALLQFRDSLNTIDAAASRLQRDYRQSSPASLLSRARVMRQACGRSVSSLPTARKAVLTAEASSERRRRRQTEMVAALDQLQKALVRCESDFAAMSRAGQGERVRGYGNERAGRVQAALRQYERTMAAFLSAMGIKVTPLGAESRPLAG
ncbi:MAG: hypothetical protein QOH59_313 [Gemmatimonadales bacterium]|jgi:hypothetical protein|nr:hypothetical protein [Gemmatimonadales bacterium]